MDVIEIILLVILVVFITFTTSYFYFASLRRFNIENVDPDLERFLTQLWKANISYSENTNNQLKALEKSILNERDASKKVKEALNNFVEHILKEMNTLSSRVSDIQQLAVDKENKIRRYEDGYDQKILNSFTSGIIKITLGLKKIKNESNVDLIDDLSEELDLLLFNAGILQTEIDAGIHINEVSDVAHVKVVEPTDEKALDGTIKSIISNGYVINISDTQRKIVKTAEVEVYKYRGE